MQGLGLGFRFCSGAHVEETVMTRRHCFGTIEANLGTAVADRQSFPSCPGFWEGRAGRLRVDCLQGVASSAWRRVLLTLTMRSRSFGSWAWKLGPPSRECYRLRHRTQVLPRGRAPVVAYSHVSEARCSSDGHAGVSRFLFWPSRGVF